MSVHIRSVFIAMHTHTHIAHAHRLFDGKPKDGKVEEMAALMRDRVRLHILAHKPCVAAFSTAAGLASGSSRLSFASLTSIYRRAPGSSATSSHNRTDIVVVFTLFASLRKIYLLSSCSLQMGKSCLAQFPTFGSI